MYNTLEKLEEQKKLIADKIDLYAEWLVKHFDNPERAKIIQDKNALSVKLHTIKFKIQNINEGKPLLGDAEDITFYAKITENKRTPSN